MKIAIVTGASSGMGKETLLQLANRFRALGEIWAVARRGELLQKLAEESPVPVRTFEADLSTPEGILTLKEALECHRPDVKFLVNAAGYGKIGPVGEVAMELECGMVRLNCESLCAVTHLVLPFMSPNSRILQFSSAAAFLPQPRFAIYAATKSFVLSYSRALNEELRGRKIVVTAVCPGPVKTAFFGIAETTGTIPLYKRLMMADPKKVVRLALCDSMAGRSISIYGPLMKGFFLLCKVCPHQLLLRAMDALQ